MAGRVPIDDCSSRVGPLAESGLEGIGGRAQVMTGGVARDGSLLRAGSDRDRSLFDVAVGRGR